MSETQLSEARIAADLAAAEMEELPWALGDGSQEKRFAGGESILAELEAGSAIILTANTNLEGYKLTTDYVVRAANGYPDALKEIRRLRKAVKAAYHCIQALKYAEYSQVAALVEEVGEELQKVMKDGRV